MKQARRLAAAVTVLLALWAGTASAQVTLSAANQCATLDVQNKGTASIELTGTWAGTVTWYVSNTGGTKLPVDLSTPAAPGTAVNSTTANGGWSGSVASWRYFVVCMTSYTSGTASVLLSSSDGGGGGGTGGGGGGDITINGTAPDTNTGNASDQTLRTIEAADSALNSALSAIQAATHNLDVNSSTDGVEGNTPAPTSGPQGMLLYTTSPATVTTGMPIRWQGSANGVASVRACNAAGSTCVTPTSAGDLPTEPHGNVAPNVADTGNPIKIGGYGSAAVPSAAGADGRRVNAWFTLNGAFVTQATDGTNLQLLDPCKTVAKTTDPFSVTARGVIIAAVSAKKNYICAITIVAGAAEIANVVEGTGTTCQTGTAAIVGSTTAANGMSFAANGGWGGGNGDATVLAGKTANVDTCLVPSGSNRLSGFVTYVQR